MKPEYALPVRYVLYTHYPEGNDFQYYRKNTPVSDLPGVKFLVKHFSNLQGLLTWPGYEGLLVLFYSPGLDECLTGIANYKSREDLEKLCEQLEFAQAVHDYIDRIKDEQYKELVSRLRFFTALDLHGVFGRVRSSSIADRLKPRMVGNARGLRYDSPKIIEAIVRLRLLGSGVPVFRVDYDVLLRGEENCDKKNLEFSSTIGSCLTAYQLRRDSPNLSSFIFSASYDHKLLRDPKSSDDFHAWGRAFATRVYPTLLFDEKLITTTLNAIEKRQQQAEADKDQDLNANKNIEADEWDCYAAKTFRPALARQFFGFGANDLVVSELGGIGELGAHPTTSVISGAMLYLSDGAIVDLPPFSNFSLNVSWIDDHLKYCLHRELGHLRKPTLQDNLREGKRSDLLTYSKMDEVIVQKAGRKIQEDLRLYIFDIYLPTLLRGTILDAWITPNPLLKFRPEELTPENRKLRSELLNAKQSGDLPSALQNALAECKFTEHARFELTAELEKSALKRITQVRQQWAALMDKGVETFASIWAKGMARRCCPDLKDKYKSKHKPKYLGIVDDPDLPVEQDLSVDDLSHAVSQDLTQFHDACNYIEWTRDWPTIVQVVRSIEQGTLKTDLNYERRQGRLSDLDRSD